jgi:acetamidase/formamidase
MARTHQAPTDRVHFTWDQAHQPILEIESGDTVFLTTRDVSDGQIGLNFDRSVLDGLDWNRVYPLCGPFHVVGAEPGDTLAVEILDLHALGWGWTAIIPGLGLLAERFREPYLRIFDLTPGDVTFLRDDIAIPIEPFLGTMGVCPVGANGEAIMPPGRVGGNMVTRHLTRGTTLYLPVQVPGALFSCGDAHAAQGDGEVCVTGIECPMYASLRFTLHKDKRIQSPQYRTAGALTPRVNHGRFYGTTGVGPDLMQAAREAVDSMVDHLSQTYRLTPEDAYLLSSLTVDLKISEIVDAGQYIVSAVFPESVVRS